MPDMIARESLLRLALLRQAAGGARPLHEVLAAFGSVAAGVARVRFAGPALREWLQPLCVDDATLRARLAADIAVLARGAAAMVALGDEDYPPLLAELTAPPPLLFVRGDRQALLAPQIAIVGSRNASPAGLATARAFAADLAAAGFVIVSGMALGVDAMAHEGALAVGGRTVAVTGCGIDLVYPQRHRALAGGIVQRGCVVTEYLPGTPPRPAHFPLRNRIISALSLGVLVVEAAPDSGSLITARFAAEQGREVFAIPGSIHSPLSRGCHQLIREGATLVETSAQLVESLAHFVSPADRLPAVVPDTVAHRGSGPALAPDEQHVLALLPAAGCSLEQVVAASGMPVARLLPLLAGLELQGRVHALAGGLWQPAAS